MSSLKRIAFSLTLASFLALATGCGGMKSFRNQLAKNAGVKTKKVTLAHRDFKGPMSMLNLT